MDFNIVRILMNIDVQVDFITGALANKTAEERMPDLVKFVKEVNADLAVATMDWHHKNYLETMEGKRLNVPHCIAGTEGAKIEPEFLKALREKFGKKKLKIAKKKTFGYYNWKKFFKRYFKDLGIEVINDGENLEFVFIGFCTDICVISNVMLIKALFPNARIIVKEKCCAGVDMDRHNTALKAMQACHIDVE